MYTNIAKPFNWAAYFLAAERFAVNMYMTEKFVHCWLVTGRMKGCIKSISCSMCLIHYLAIEANHSSKVCSIG